MDDGASEAELRDDEAICPVTGLTYFKNLPRSPHYEIRNGRIVLT